MKRLGLFFTLAILLGLQSRAQSLRFFEFDFHSPYPDSLNLFAATMDPAVQADCDAELLLADSLRFKHINGLLGHGTGDNNPLFSWHFVQGEWALAEVSIELCDGRPLEDVEADTAYWLGTVKYFCPWNSYVKRKVIVTTSPEASPDAGIALWPNPVVDQLKVQNNGKSVLKLVSLLDGQGRQVQMPRQDLQPHATSSLDFGLLPAGAYYLVLWRQGGFWVEKVMH